MADKKVHLRVITPSGVIVNDNVDMAIMRCTTGDLGVLYGHESRSAVLDYGVFRIFKGGKERRLAVHGGIVKIEKTEPTALTVLTNAAELPEDIDLARAESKRERAETIINESNENTDNRELQMAEISLRKSLVRIEVSSYPIISNVEWDE